MSIRGWVFGPGGQRARSVRVRIDDQILDGSVGYYRPDVSESFPAVSDDYCGFHIAFYPPRGPSSLKLEAEITAGAWQEFARYEAKGPSWKWPVAFGGGKPEDILAGQLSLIAQHSPRPLRQERFPSPSNSRPLPRVSIVIPSLNQGRWLEKAITSTGARDNSTIDLRVWDGGSSDASVDILKRHDAEITEWKSEPDGGQSRAIASAFAASSGEPDDVMAWVNADDFFLPGAVEFVQRYFAQHPDIDVVYGNRVLVNEEDEEIGRWHLAPHDPDVLRLYDFVPQETLFWRRRAWEKVGGVDPEYQFAMDWDLLLRFQESGANIRHLPRFLGAFRLHRSQKSSAQIGSTGQDEIERLRVRSFGRELSAAELIHAPELQRYLRRCARRAFFARLRFWV